MKNLIIALLLLVPSLILAQNPVGKGTYTIGGTISFSRTSESGFIELKNDGFESKLKRSNSNDIFTIAPKMGYFFIDNVYTGMSLQYTYQSGDNNSSSTYGIGPAVRYYFNISQVKPFLGLEYTYQFSSFENDTDEDTQKSFTISGGIDYFITNYFALEASLNYSMSDYKSENSDFSTDFETKTFVLGIGAMYFIN